MKPLTYLTMLAVFSTVPFRGRSQSHKYHPDTIYYYADTAATPKQDRMVTLGSEPIYIAYKNKVDTIKYLTIQCACLPFGYSPDFYVHQGNFLEQIKRKDVNKIKFITLNELIALVRQDYKKDFYHKHKIMVVERIKHRYYQQQMFLTEYRDPINDYEIIKPNK